MTTFEQPASADDADFDALLDAFKRSPEDPLPEWALDPSKDISKQLEKLPLFMTQLPENPEDNVQLQALQALLYEGTSEEIAANFKEQGNDAFQKGAAGYKDALLFYTRGLDQRCSDDKLNAQLWSNRSAANLALKNYGYALRDAAKAIALNRNDVKAYWRGSSAALALKRFVEADQLCTAGLKLFPENDKLKSLVESISQQRCELEAQEAKLAADRKAKEMLIEAFQSRGVAYELDAEQPSLAELGPGFFGSEAPTAKLTDNGTLLLPLLFMYPPAGQADFIQEATEDDSLIEHLATVFEMPAPWDQESQLYSDPACMTAYVRSQGSTSLAQPVLYRIHPQKALKTLFGSAIKAAELGIIVLYVLPEGTEACRFEKKFLDQGFKIENA